MLVINSRKEVETFYEYYQALLEVMLKNLKSNEIKYLAYMMSIYPNDVDAKHKREIKSLLGVKDSYISQIASKLDEKRLIVKEGNLIKLSNNNLITLAKAKEENDEIEFKVTFKVVSK